MPYDIDKHASWPNIRSEDHSNKQMFLSIDTFMPRAFNTRILDDLPVSIDSSITVKN